MTWYKKWFSENDYLTVYAHRNDDDAEKIINLIKKIENPVTGCKILDLACGNGRHSIELAKRGFDVTGIDLSDPLLDIAKKRSAQLNLKIEFLKADMRELNFEERFDGVINLFTSFGYFEEDSENERVISQISLSLKKNGWFVIDFFNSIMVLNNFNPEDKKEFENLQIFQKREIRNNRIIKDISIIRNGEKKEYHESVRLFNLDDFKCFFSRNSLIISNIFGDYNGNAFTESSDRLIMFGKKE
jgi:SAM-dependent methyltransferase